MELNYEEKEGILYPQIQISENQEADQKPLGKYGQMSLNYLKKNHLNRYNLLLATGKLIPMMHEVNEQAYKLLETIMNQELEENPLTNQQDTMLSFQEKIQAKSIAEEIVLREIVFKER
ncbi:TnpV protein [Clostridium botulinum]|uniref:TnpV protein n=1 Tax=Clostridium botulinum TaxID=1491 RepID=UPI0013C77383|nr:TnpV protein [Clostridium botulinum]NFI64766.1 TnpV protein [Clostridium botulinum]NFJ45644.1 TnpV protein [Clostridium botulinum]NFJ49229.1 TnpV protein [Clostridium botulinum]NFK26927.1 TnpV protein [Clostridium botulinum]